MPSSCLEEVGSVLCGGVVFRTAPAGDERDAGSPLVEKKCCCPFSSLTHSSESFSCDGSGRLNCWTWNAVFSSRQREREREKEKGLVHLQGAELSGEGSCALCEWHQLAQPCREELVSHWNLFCLEKSSMVTCRVGAVPWAARYVLTRSARLLT